MKRNMFLVGAIVLASFACAMPSEREPEEAKPLVESLIADDMKALKQNKMRPIDVVSSQYRLAKKAETEAGKFLLLKNAFNICTTYGLYTAAAQVLQCLRDEITDFPPEEIVKMVDKTMKRADPDKAPKVLSIYNEAKRNIDCRRRLQSIKAELKKKPSDKVLMRKLADCHVCLGDWANALALYAKLGFDAAKYEIAPDATVDYDILKAADFWWDYKAADEKPFKTHAAGLYHSAVDKGIVSGLRREMALKRIKEAMPLDANSAQANAGTTKKVGKIRKTGDITTIILPGGAKMEMIFCDRGSYRYGTSNAQMIMDHAFWLGKYEVTQQQWKSVMRGTEIEDPFKRKDENLLAEKISWDDCQTFMRKVKAGLKCNVRLPNEHEWEYACRAGNETQNYQDADSMMWHDGNSGIEAHIVGQRRANAWGFYDMLGNVWEWCSEKGVLRGGSYSCGRKRCVPSARKTEHPYFGWDTGFRLCISAE